MKPVQKRGVDGVKALPRESEVLAEAARTGAPGLEPQPASALEQAGLQGGLGAVPQGQARAGTQRRSLQFQNWLTCVCLCMYVYLYTHGERNIQVSLGR